MKKKIMAVLLSSVLLLSSCGNNNNAGTTNAGSESPSSGGQTASGGSSGGESSPVKASSDDMWEILPKIDETPVEYLSYHITDEIGSEIGIIVDGILEPGITKIRIPERIEGKPVVGVDLMDDKVTELILPETVQPVYINQDFIEYMNYTVDMVLNYDYYSYYSDTRLVKPIDKPNFNPDRFDTKTLKGIYFSSGRKKYVGAYDTAIGALKQKFGKAKNAKFLFRGKIYDYNNVYEIFIEEPSLGYILNDDGTVIKAVGDSVKELIVPEGVTELHKSAPKIVYNDTLTKITTGYRLSGDVVIPDQITYFDNFKDNKDITSLVTGNGVTVIKEDCFKNCTNLKSVTFGTGITSIEGYAFYNCSSLEDVYIPDNVKSISVGAFIGCDAIKKVSIPADCSYANIKPNLSFSGICDIEIRNADGSITVIPGSGPTLASNTEEIELKRPDEYVTSESTSQSASDAGNDTTSQAGSDNICAVDILGNTIADVEQMYGIKLNQNGSTYTADNFPYELSVSQFDSYTFISSVIITGDGRLDDTIKCGMTYNEIKAASKAPIYDPYYSEELYKGVAANIDFDFAVATVVWDTSNVDDIGDMPCSKIEYSSAL